MICTFTFTNLGVETHHPLTLLSLVVILGKDGLGFESEPAKAEYLRRKWTEVAEVPESWPDDYKKKNKKKKKKKKTNPSIFINFFS